LPKLRWIDLRKSGRVSEPPKLWKLLYFRQMASITLSLPDDLASQIQAQQQQLPPNPGAGFASSTLLSNPALPVLRTFWSC